MSSKPAPSRKTYEPPELVLDPSMGGIPRTAAPPGTVPLGDEQPGAEDAPPPNASNDEIARRAYERYEARGREDGHHEEDWLAAERDLRDAD